MEDMEDTFNVHSIDEVNVKLFWFLVIQFQCTTYRFQELIEEHRAFTASIGDAEREKNSILEYGGSAADPETGNHYTSVSPNVCSMYEHRND